MSINQGVFVLLSNVTTLGKASQDVVESSNTNIGSVKVDQSILVLLGDIAAVACLLYTSDAADE